VNIRLADSTGIYLFLFFPISSLLPLLIFGEINVYIIHSVFNGILPLHTMSRGPPSEVTSNIPYPRDKTGDDVTTQSPSGAVERFIALYQRFLYSLDPLPTLGSGDSAVEPSVVNRSYSETMERFPRLDFSSPTGVSIIFIFIYIYNFICM